VGTGDPRRGNSQAPIAGLTFGSVFGGAELAPPLTRNKLCEFGFSPLLRLRSVEQLQVILECGHVWTAEFHPFN
jgi:hypothetical protein